MAVNRKQLIEPQALTGSVATIYTVPALFNTQLAAVTVSNPTAGAVALTLHIVPDGGTADATNKVIPAKTLAANETYICPELTAQTLPAGTTIQASGLGLVVFASGVEFT